jgi:hypothetical protein
MQITFSSAPQFLSFKQIYGVDPNERQTLPVLIAVRGAAAAA